MSDSLQGGSQPRPDFGFGEILIYFSGIVLLMGGRREGTFRLDFSADGFWQSFLAIPVAAPAVALSWVEFEAARRASGRHNGEPLNVFLAHGVADLLAWLLPVALVLAFARPLGLRRKVAPLVIVSNWGAAFLAWVFVPIWATILVFGRGDAIAAIGTLAIFAGLILSVRMLSTALGRDLATAGGYVALTILSSLLAYGLVMDMTGIALI